MSAERVAGRSVAAVPTPPSGTVTFLFTDIEGSTRMWQDFGDEMRAALEVHDALIRAAVDATQGYVFATGVTALGSPSRERPTQ